MKRSPYSGYGQRPILIFIILGFVCLFPPLVWGQGTDSRTAQQTEALTPVEVEPPDEAQRETAARTGTTSTGFGAEQPIPQGFAGSDYSLTPGEVVSPTRTPTNLSRVNSAVSVIEDRGVESLGYRGVPDMLQGTVGLWTSGFSATPFDSAPVMRGFSNGCRDGSMESSTTA